ncbi:hypothetical protein EK21DRAFT_88081 [Setomelanomma holmii]|uniref:Subtelomeric hrmA-associated cluster protein AFUB-079030/YDR124W-like helical bundle domain-containing protein n=1 Tax=Setomelanomma holmii TaxID=210430 RepID=A0A9P4LP47_9PLEO|nr:hypothetical protein EK21DRAFT_88081 [Setomelanomma holmii]
MARPQRMDESAKRTDRKATQPQNKRSIDRQSFGRDSWVLTGYGDTAAGSKASSEICFVFSCRPTRQRPTRLSVVPPSLAAVVPQTRVSGRSLPQTNSTPNTAIKVEECDGIALPTPIHATVPCKIVAADGREEYIYTPIGGFEHLFKVPQSVQGVPRPSHATNVALPASRPQQLQAPGDTALFCTVKYSPSLAGASRQRQGPTRGQDDMQPQNDRAPKTSTVATRLAEPKPAKQRALKRTHSVAQGLSQPREVSDSSDNDEDEDDMETTVVTESARHFQIGNIKALKYFFRHRIDELTMKPVRGMVTAWIKQLEPRRLGGYGPYHKKLPAEAPADATPPWWPESVPYVEPAHLDKDGLLTLAVEVMLQHRDTPIDRIKRRSPWTSKLRQIAEYHVETTAPEHFSSSKSAVFSRLMKDRAVTSILPSLFEASQSYEDFIFQHDLWKYENDNEIPKGKSLTWQPVPRPPKQTSQRKRVRKIMVPGAIRGESDADSYGDASENDTEVDDTMARISMRHTRRVELSARQSAMQERQRAQGTQASARGMNTHTVAAVEAPAPVAVAPSPMTSTPQKCFPSTQMTPTPNSSFDQSLDRLHLHEDAKPGNPATPDQHSQQSQHKDSCFDQSMQCYNAQIEGTNNSYQPMQAPASLSNAGAPHSSQFSEVYIDPGHFSMFNDPFPNQMSQSSIEPPIQAHDMSYSYPMGEMFLPTGFMAQLSSNTNPSFHGLPYDYPMQDAAQPSHDCVPRTSALHERQ